MMRTRKLAESIGSEIAEAALVIPIFFMILLGIYYFGRAFNVYATINHAAREGARVATVQTCATCAPANGPLTAALVADQVKQALLASHLDLSQVTNAGGNRPACGGGSVGCAVIGGPGEPNICVRFNVQLPATAALIGGAGPTACGVSVEFQYPYQFWLPFTSLNNQPITLNAGVQMTGEY